MLIAQAPPALFLLSSKIPASSDCDAHRLVTSETGELVIPALGAGI